MGSDKVSPFPRHCREVSIRAPAWGATDSILPKQSLPMFQFALPHGERRFLIRSIPTAARFQFALPHGERHIQNHLSAFIKQFQFALPHGERRNIIIVRMVVCMFQFALPHGERRNIIIVRMVVCMFQFALPHGERLSPEGMIAQFMNVSIRAPAWGATYEQRDVRAQVEVSIRAPAWGATGYPLDGRFPHKCFNSRSRMGSDCRQYAYATAGVCFNSRSRMGSDHALPRV